MPISAHAGTIVSAPGIRGGVRAPRPTQSLGLGAENEDLCVGRAAPSPPLLAPSVLLHAISNVRCGAGVRDVEDAVPYKPRSKARTLVGGGVFDAPLQAVSILRPEFAAG